MKRLMLDLETLGRKPNAIIQSIAIQQFNIRGEEIGAYIHLFLPIHEQMDEGREMDPDTLVWWQKQSLTAQIRVLEGRRHAEDTEFTLTDARKMVELHLHDADEIWANDPDFDCVILKDFMGPDFKWPFWTHRSCRTMRSLAPDLERTTPEIPHDALSDCHAQITDLRAQYVEIFGTAQKY